MNKKIVAFIISVLILCSCTAVFAMTDSNETEILSPAYDLGDVDMNFKVNVKDATSVQKHIAEIIILSEQALVFADANLDGSINIKDATYIQKVVAGLAEQLRPEATDPATDAPTAAEPTEEDITVPESSQTTDPTEEPATPESSQTTDPTEEPATPEYTQSTDPTEGPAEETTPAVLPTDPTEAPTQETTETPTEEPTAAPTEATQPATKDPDKPIELPFIPVP